MIVGVDGISMLALSAEQEVLGLESIHIPQKKFDSHYFEAELNEILSTQKLLTYTFGTLHTALSVPLATLVPFRLFSPDDYPKYFHLLQPTKPATIFGHETLEEFGCQLVWGADNCFQHYYRRYQPKHLAGKLISAFYELSDPKGHSIFTNIRGNQAQIAVFDQRILVFYNTFEFNKPSDLLYFVLLVYEQFRLQPEKSLLQLSGSLLESGEHYKMLFKYIRNIVFVAPKAAPPMPESKNALPIHYWFDLLSL